MADHKSGRVQPIGRRKEGVFQTMLDSTVEKGEAFLNELDDHGVNPLFAFNCPYYSV